MHHTRSHPLHVALPFSENVCRSLYGTDEAALNDDSFSAQIQQLQQTLASLEALPEAELAPLKQHIHNAERLLAHLREHGSLPSLTQALEESSDDESAHEQSILKERSEEHTSELQSRGHLVCRLL